MTTTRRATNLGLLAVASLAAAPALAQMPTQQQPITLPPTACRFRHIAGPGTKAEALDPGV